MSQLWSCLVVAGNGGESASGAVKGEVRGPVSFGGGVVVGFCFGGRRGPVSFRAVKGEGGPVSFGVVLFCGEWRRVSFRGCEGGQSVSFGGGVVVGFCFGGRRGPVSFRAVKGKGGESALGLVRGMGRVRGL